MRQRTAEVRVRQACTLAAAVCAGARVFVLIVALGMAIREKDGHH